MTKLDEMKELIEEGTKFSSWNFNYLQPMQKRKIQKWACDVQIFASHSLDVSAQRAINEPCTYLKSDPMRPNYDSLMAVLISDLEYYIKHPDESLGGTIDQSKKKYDVFISHARKDKLTYVDSLMKEIKKLGVNIFYDTDVIDWGDNWKTVILEGTAKSEFAIIVISENFFGREWAEKELEEFLGRQNTNKQKIVLPLLHGITVERLKEVYSSLGDIQCISTAEKDEKEIAIIFARQLIRRLKGE